MSEPENELDAARLLRALEDAGVKFVLIGGFATIVHGYERATGDLDICYERSRTNLERLATVLQSLHAHPRGWPEGAPFILDAQALLNGDSFTFTTDAGDLDVLATPSGSAGFADLWSGSVEMVLGDDLRVHVVGLDDLIRLKRAAGRGKDLIDVAALEEIRATLWESEHQSNHPSQPNRPVGSNGP